MAEYETDLSGKILSRKEEIDIIYDGPSFEGKMEISHLSSQLKSTENVIRDIVSEVYKKKRFKNPNEVKIYLQLKRGSFGEIISIVFNNPTVAHIIGGGIVALFIHFLEKRRQKQNNISIYIKNLIKNYNFAKNLNQIIAPLEDTKDEIHILSSDPKIKTSITFADKKKMNQSLKKLKEEISVEIHEEEFFGYLSEVDIDKGKFCFTLEETEKHIPTIFDSKPSLKEIRKILGLRLKINAIVTRKEGALEKLEIRSYNLKERKNLKDF